MHQIAMNMINSDLQSHGSFCDMAEPRWMICDVVLHMLGTTQ